MNEKFRIVFKRIYQAVFIFDIFAMIYITITFINSVMECGFILSEFLFYIILLGIFIFCGFVIYWVIKNLLEENREPKEIFNSLLESMPEQSIKSLCLFHDGKPYSLNVIKLEVENNTKLGDIFLKELGFLEEE